MENMRKMLGMVGLSAVLFFTFGIAPAHAQATAGKFASPELVNTLTKDLKVTPEQATGGAGSLFSLAY